MLYVGKNAHTGKMFAKLFILEDKVADTVATALSKAGFDVVRRKTYIEMTGNFRFDGHQLTVKESREQRRNRCKLMMIDNDKYIELIPDTTWEKDDYIIKFAQKLDDPNTFCYGIWLPGAEDIDLDSFGNTDIRFNCYLEDGKYIVWGISIFADPRVMAFMETFTYKYRVAMESFTDDSALDMYNSIVMEIISEGRDDIIRLDANFQNYTLVEGTLVAEDIVEAIMTFLRNNHDGAYTEALLRIEDLEFNGVRWEEDDELLNDFLFPLMDIIAPLGYYFGSHPGSGSCFGFWECEEKKYEIDE